MKKYKDLLHPYGINTLKQGGIGVLKTDTLYGVVASVLSREAVERVYQLRQRHPRKACIVLLADASHLPSAPPLYAEQLIAHSWPGPVSIVLPVSEVIPEWLHRGEGSLAFRVPGDAALRELLKQTGPLIAPSANLEGQPPAATVAEAHAYFGDGVDFYIDTGPAEASQPSRLLRPLEDGRIERLR